MEGSVHKLYSWDKEANLFDCDRFIINLQPEFLEFLKNEGNLKKNIENLTTVDILRISTRSHEYQHYLNIIGTPVGIYDTLIRFASLAQISFLLNLYIYKRDKVYLPFLKHMDDDPTISFTYKLSEALTSYLYGKPDIEDLEGIDYIDNAKLELFFCSKLFDITRVESTFPGFILKFKKDGEITSEYVPIGLHTILEGFSRINQDITLLGKLSFEQFWKPYENRMADGNFTAYYILQFYARNLLDGLNSLQIDTIVCLSFYFSLMCLRPINQWPFSPCFCVNFKDHIDEEAENFFSNLSHPGFTFLDAFYALKEIAKEEGGVPTDRKGVTNLIKKTCERIGCLPINFLYKEFETFLAFAIDKLCPMNFYEFPFAKHYFNISLKLMEKAKDNVYDFIFHPWTLISKTKVPITPMVFCEKYIINPGSDKLDWFHYSSIMDQFFNKKRIICPEKIFFGTNKHCKNDKDCSLDRVDYPYSKCEDNFIKDINGTIGDVTKLLPS
jgi:hypothetical protein